MVLNEEQKAEQPKEPTVVSSSSVTDTTPEMIPNTIEAKATGNEPKKAKRSNKRNIILTIVFFAISLIILFLTVRFILKIDWTKFFGSISDAFTHKMGYLWFTLLIIAGFINILRCFVTLMPRIASYGCHISFGEYLLFGLTSAFLGLVTPLSFVSDPYCVFWMKTHGISTSKCASLMFSNGFLYQISQFLITIPAFIICCINRHLLLSDAKGRALFAFICIGAIFDMFNFAFTLIMCLWKQAHYVLARLFNWFKKILHMKYHTKEQTKEKYKKNEAIKRDFINYMKDWKTTLIIFLLYASGDVLGTMFLSWGMYFVQWTPVMYDDVNKLYEIAKIGFSYGDMFNCARLASLANRINIIPGQQIGYEAALTILCTRSGGWKEIVFQQHPGIQPSSDAIKEAHELITNNGTFITRIFISYLPSLAGIGGFVTLTVRQVRQSKHEKLIKEIY